MSAVAEARAIFRVVPRGVDQTKADWLRFVARLFSLTFSQAKKIEYLELKDMRASRLDAMRAKFAEMEESAAKRRETLNDLAARLAEIRSIRSGQGSGDSDGGGDGAAPSGGRGDGAGEGSDGADRKAAAAVPRAE
jgi:hypothetical protein